MLEKIHSFILQIFRYFPIFLIKKPIGHKFPLHAFMPLVGYWHVVRERAVNRLLWPLLSLFGVGIFLSLFHGHYLGVARCLQTMGIILLADFLVLNFKQSDFIVMARSILILSLVYLAVEYAFLGIPYRKMILPGVKWIRFSGLVGESNFSAICIALLTVHSLFFDKKKYYVLIGLISLVLFASRIAIILFLLGAFGIFIHRFLKKLGKLSVYSLGAIPFFFPLFIFMIESFATDKVKLLVEKIVNGRYVINACYLKMFFENPLGVGYFRGRSMYKHYGLKGSSLIENGLFRYPGNFAWTEYEHHNLFMQTLSELGFWGYGLLIFFVWQIFRRYQEELFLSFYLFAITLVGFSSLNGYNEYILYFMIAFLLKQIQSHGQVDAA